ncbi:MAG: M3 family metallopeptidase [Gemmatimonadota bacterium]|nr:M3 family metallopeptidase [Gemmatimonadota bacterium]
MDGVTENPLLNWTNLPPFDRIEVEHIKPAVKTLIERSEETLSTLEAQPADAWTWDRFMVTFEKVDDDLARIWGVVSHLHSVKNSQDLRDVYDPLLADIVTFSNRMGQSKPLYNAYLALRNGPEWEVYDEARKRIIESGIREAELNGVALEDDARARYNEISQRQAEIATKYSNNVLDDTKAFRFKLDSADDVEGLPDTLLELGADEARRDGFEDATAETGPWVVTLEIPSFMPFMQHSKRRDLRMQMYRAYVTRASVGEYDNTEIIDETLALRNEKARLLGFHTYADLSLSRKMAADVESVEDLLDELQKAARPGAEHDLDDLRDLAREEGASEADDFKQWDSAYWSERLREQRYDIRDEELRPYFPLPGVLDGLFKLTERLFNIKVVQADGEAPVWHEDVQFFKVYDDAEGLMAGFYLDVYSRPGEKRGGAWMNTCVGRSKVLAPLGEPVRLPVAYMMCNQSKPVGGKPSLMSFMDVETLFHEFGHGLQHMLTTVDEGLAAGLANIEWDAVELASHFMENWCFHPGTLKGLARHYETNEPLPDEIVERLRATRTFREGSNTLRQVNFGLLDLELHHRFTSDSPETPLEVQARIDQNTLILPPLPEDKFICSFSHIFAGGYAAGYYSYKWSEVLSADAFSAFEEAGLDDDVAIRELGSRYRNTILALGGSAHPMDVFKAFRGREPSTQALLKQGGLK